MPDATTGPIAERERSGDFRACGTVDAAPSPESTGEPG